LFYHDQDLLDFSSLYSRLPPSTLLSLAPVITSNEKENLMKNAASIYWVFLSLWLTACSSTPLTRSAAMGYEESGEASYYADKYQGRQTASGERFNQHAHTAAHKRLPFGTKVKVTNVANGKSVIVRINDRGPFVRGRIIDLSKSAFQRIASTHHGVIDVEISVLN